MARERSNRGWLGWIVVGFLLTALSVGRTATLVDSVERMAPEARSELDALELRVQGLERQLARLQEREELHDWIQHEIRRANPRVGIDEARDYAGLLLEITDKYISVDPLFLLAVGIVESHFDCRATSHARAKGLYQIWPATGRWLAGELGWEYSEAMLYEPARNTELAALYLDKLFDRYGDPRLVLAEYNGGPVNARRLKNGSDRLAAETKHYVVKVMNVLEGLNQRLDPEPVRAAEWTAD